MSRGVVICLALWTVILASPTLAEPGGLEEIDRLLAAGEAEQALEEVHRLRAGRTKAQEQAQRLTSWELDFQGEVRRVTAGREVLYYLLSVPNSRKHAPGRHGALDAVSANRSRSDRRFVAVCVDLRDGEIRWSREVNGLAYVAVDPESDALHLYYDQVVALDPSTGAVLELHELSGKRRRLEGLLFGRELTLAWPDSSRISLEDPIAAYDVRRRMMQEVRPGDFLLLAPDKSRRLVYTGKAWEAQPVAEGLRRWTFAGVFPRGTVPIWHQGHPLFVTGRENRRGAVTSVDLVTGVPRWSTALGWGTYTPNEHQLRDGGSQDLWTPLSFLDEHLLALGGDGRLHLLDANDGRMVAAPRLSRNYLAVPFQHGEQLIVPSFRWVRSYSLAHLLAPEDSFEVALQVREAGCLLALGKATEAMSLLDALVERAPESSVAWAEQAVAARALHQLDEAVRSRTRAMQLAGETFDSMLCDERGLLRQFDLKGRPSWQLKEVAGHVYAGTLGGGLWRVETSDLDFELGAWFDHGIKHIGREDELAVSGNYAHTWWEIPTTPPKPPEGTPSAWYTKGGPLRISGATSYQGRQFRSLKGGGVRVLDGAQMVDLPPKLDDIGEWKIHLSPSGPLGYGEGVFTLDKDLRPVRWLIEPTLAGERVLLLASTSRSLAAVMSSSRGALLQVYSRAGVLLNEVPLGPRTSGQESPKQLIPLSNGYLFSDRQLHWAGLSRSHVWKFGPPLAYTSGKKRGDRWRYFGDPLVVGTSLFVTDLDGRLLVFDVMRMTERHLAP